MSPGGNPAYKASKVRSVRATPASVTATWMRLTGSLKWGWAVVAFLFVVQGLIVTNVEAEPGSGPKADDRIRP